MGQEESTLYAACGTTREDACEHLELFLCFYIDKDYRIEWKSFMDKENKRYRILVATRSGQVEANVYCEFNAETLIHSASVAL